jgi:hypothetical protein
MTPAEPVPTAEGGGRIRLDDYDGQPALWADGVIHSVAVAQGATPQGYWPAMLPEAAPRSALLLGVGGGTLAHLLAGRHPGVQMLGVDNDPQIVAFAREHFSLALPNLEIVIADAFHYANACERRFDFIGVDLFTGHTFHRGVLARPFLRRLRALLCPGGEIAVNLVRDRRAEVHLSRLRRLLPLQRVDRLPRNLVAHSRPDAAAAEAPRPRDQYRKSRMS